MSRRLNFREIIVKHVDKVVEAEQWVVLTSFRNYLKKQWVNRLHLVEQLLLL